MGSSRSFEALPPSGARKEPYRPSPPETESHVSAGGNSSPAECPQVCLHELFEAQARRTPKAIAVADTKRQLTYSQLNARANQLARYLRRRGVGPEVMVGIALERSAARLVALLGILKSGGAYVPLDPEFPPDRLAFMVRDSGLQLILTRSSLLDNVPEPIARRVNWDAEQDSIAGESEEDFPSAVEPQNLAYVTYTSGSTGRPKGVLISHRSLVNVLESLRLRPGFTAQGIFLATTTLSFDIAAVELFLPLISGGRVFVARRAVANRPEQLQEYLVISGATVLQGVPSFWRLLIESGWPGDRKLKLFCGGEELRPPLAQAMLERSASVWNMYAPSETTIYSTVYQVTGAESPIAIGTPIANTQAYVLDEALGQVPVGEVGELHLGGDGLARGYLNRPELTAQKFIHNPFSDQPGARLYKTGDLARFRPDGNLEYVGRLDDQVKIRGFRIELGEIEAVLAEHLAVGAAAAAVREVKPGETLLMAYVVPRPGHSIQTEEVRSYLKTRLPDYMLPARIEILNALPLVASGKIDRQALPAPESSREAAADLRSAPQTELEKKLERIFADVLGLDWAGIDENFFALGGDSLHAIRLITRIEKALGRKISLASLFQAPTVRELAAFLSDSRPTYEVLRALPIQPRGARPPFFCVGGGPATRALGQILAPEQPFLGLVFEERDLKTLPAPFRVEDLAAILIRKMQDEQPTGPYFLGGWCFPAYVAYEMGQQLRAKGEEVGLLALIWTRLPPQISKVLKPPGLAVKASQWGQRMRFFISQVREAGWTYVSKRLAVRLPLIGVRARMLAYRLYYELGLQIPGWLRDMDSIENVSCSAYRPEPYWGRVALILPQSPAPTPIPEEDDWAWSALVKGKLEVHRVPFVDHLEADVLDEQNVDLAAKKLTEILFEAQRAAAGVEPADVV